MNKLNNKYLLLIFRIILGSFFVLSSIDKIADPESFALSIQNYRIFPVFIINIFALTLPWIELLAGLFLVLGIRIRENSFIINVLLVTFNLMLIIALVRGLDIDCGCFGSAYSQKVGFLKISENFLLLFFGILLQIHSSDFLTIIGRDENRTK